VWLLLFSLLGLIAWLFWRFPLSELIDDTALAQRIADLGWMAVPVFLTIASIATAVGLPRQLFAFVGGYSFGTITGVVLGSLAAIVGCYLCFACARHVLRKPVLRRYANFVCLLDSFVHNDAFLKIIVLRLQPLGTNLMTNLAAGVSKIPARVFLTSSLIGYVPQMLVFALLGSGVRVHSNTQMLVSVALCLVSFLIGGFLYKRHRMRVA